MKLYKYPLKVVAFFYELLLGLKDIFSKPYSKYRLYLIMFFVSDINIKITEQFARIDSIRFRMEQYGYSKYRKYFRSKILSKDTQSPKKNWCPLIYIPGIPSEPFPKKENFSWAKDWEENYQIILDEFLRLMHDEGMRPYHVAETGGKLIINEWLTFFFVDQYGVRRDENVKKCPKTWELLNKVPRFVDNNMTMFSVLEPRSTIQEHTGWCNLFVRVHLALINKDPSRTAINVGNEINTWKEGELLFLDDSFFHQVWNSSDYYRAVLFFDVWHPTLSDEEVSQLKTIYNEVRSMDEFKKLSSMAQEIEKKSMKRILQQ